MIVARAVRPMKWRWGMSWLTALVIGRVLAESGSTAQVDIDEEQLLLIKRHDVVVGCTPGDGGVGGDAAVDATNLDAGGGADAGGSADAAVGDASVGDAGLGDAGVPDAGTCTMIPGDAVTMVVQPRVTTTVEGTRFAVLLVTPSRPIVELSGEVFGPLAEASAPTIQTHRVEVPDPALGTTCWRISGGGGCFGYSSYPSGPSWTPPAIGDAGLGDGAVVEEMIGPYQFVRAQPASAVELAGWLDQLGYAYMPADLDAVAPYIALGYHVVAIRVAIADPLSAPMIPIALTWPGSELRVPAALGRGAAIASKLTVYIAAEGQYQFASAEVHFAGRTSVSDAPYVTKNEIMLDQNAPASLDPVAVRVADAPLREIEDVTEEVHVPVTVDCSDQDGGCCSDCNAKPRARFDWLTLVLAVGFVLRRRRR